MTTSLSVLQFKARGEGSDTNLCWSSFQNNEDLDRINVVVLTFGVLKNEEESCAQKQVSTSEVRKPKYKMVVLPYFWSGVVWCSVVQCCVV